MLYAENIYEIKAKLGFFKNLLGGADMKEILFYPSKMKNLITIFILVLFSSPVIYFLYSKILFSKDWCIALGVLAIFGVLLVTIFYTTFVKPTPSLKLNETGIFTQRCPFIEWSNVRNVQVKKKGWATFLCIYPYNVNKLLDREKLSYIKKLKLSLTKAMFGTIIAVKMDNLSISQKDIFELINEFKKNWADKYLRN